MIESDKINSSMIECVLHIFKQFHKMEKSQSKCQKSSTKFNLFIDMVCSLMAGSNTFRPFSSELSFFLYDCSLVCVNSTEFFFRKRKNCDWFYCASECAETQSIAGCQSDFSQKVRFLLVAKWHENIYTHTKESGFHSIW